MKEQFVPYEQALELKELGFDEECLALYQSNRNNKPIININNKINIEVLLSGKIKNEDVQYLTKAPLWQQAFDWFRKEHNLHYSILGFEYWVGEKIGGFPTGVAKSYEEAREECLKKLIELCKNVK